MFKRYHEIIKEEWSTEAPLTGADWSFLPEEIIQTMIPNFMSERPSVGGRLTVENSEEIEECIRECQKLQEDNSSFIIHADKSPEEIFSEFIHQHGEKIDTSVCRDIWTDSINSQWITVIKEGVRRPRPYWIDDRIKPMEGTENFSWSFPSGHSVCARYTALKLGSKFPHLKDGLIKLSNQIGKSRIQAGVHFPSDVEAGLLLGETFFNIRK